MSKHPLLHGARGERHVLLGNEAIVRGALEAGVNMVTCYPGTPSSEVPDTFYKLGGEGRYKIEYAVNEKVAFEVAAGAALGGAQALVTMKHVGLNVAADPLFTSVYTGLPGGLVVLSADDPGCHSSQNEQDNRYYARFASLPCFEPVSAQEAKDMTREAFRLARELQQPVLLRTTTRVSHMRGNVEFDDLPAGPAPIVDFQRNPGRFVPVPAVARGRHRSLLEIMEKARAFFAHYKQTVHKDSALFDEEERIIDEIFAHYDLYGMFGGILCTRDRAIGLSIGEIYKDTLHVHVEKGDISFPGVYQMLSHQFAAAFSGPDVLYINREDDMGDPGLRKSKLSYHPCALLEKFTVTVPSI